MEDNIIQFPGMLEDDGEPADPTSLTLGQKLEHAFLIRAEIDELDEIKKQKNAQLEQLQLEITAEMTEKDLEKIECQYGSAKSKTEPYPNIKDWALFTKWIKDNDRFEFVEKRVSRSAAKDMLVHEGKLPPGIDVFMKSSIEFRKKSVRRKK